MGGALGGVFLAFTPLAHGGLQLLSPQMWCRMLLVAMVGLTGYFYMNQVMSMLGAFYTRVVELWQVPMLWAIHLLTEHAHLEWTQGVMSVVVASASAYAYCLHKKRLLAEHLGTSGCPLPGIQRAEVRVGWNGLSQHLTLCAALYMRRRIYETAHERHRVLCFSTFDLRAE